MNCFDTARAYSDSEEKVGAAFAGMRDKVYIATKTGATTAEAHVLEDLEESLRMLQTDYIDVYQFHNPAFCPKPGGEDGLYEQRAALEAKKQGKIRHIAIRQPPPPLCGPPGHRLPASTRDHSSSLYSHLAGPQEQELVDKRKATRHGALSPWKEAWRGGLIRDGMVASPRLLLCMRSDPPFCPSPGACEAPVGLR
ncbi:MAG: aldo/keto reductase [Oscillospiraceae bacterium]